jgi:hypothetical protein
MTDAPPTPLSPLPSLRGSRAGGWARARAYCACALHKSECDCTTQGKAHETPLALHLIVMKSCSPYVWCSTRCFTHVMWRLWIVSPLRLRCVKTLSGVTLHQYGSHACTNASLVYNERGPATLVITFSSAYFTPCTSCLHAPSTLSTHPGTPGANIHVGRRASAWPARPSNMQELPCHQT